MTKKKNKNEQFADSVDRIIESTPGFKRRINESYAEFKVSGGMCADALMNKLKDALNRKHK
jgi:hypothetical protein